MSDFDDIDDFRLKADYVRDLWNELWIEAHELDAAENEASD